MLILTLLKQENCKRKPFAAAAAAAAAAYGGGGYALILTLLN